MTHGRCYFLDVGQGTANVILLKGRRAIVLDAGPAKHVGVVHRLLKDFAGTIECVLLSHHDADHVAGWEEIAADFQGNIGTVWCIPDAHPSKGQRIDITMHLAKQGKIPLPSPALVDSLKAPKIIWQDDQSPMRLEILYPDLLGQYSAIKGKDHNRASVVAVLRCNKESILFPGDCDIEAWRRLRDVSPHLPLKVDLLAVPHHGGLPSQSAADLQWLYRDAVKPGTAIFSVGTSNDEGHPRAEVVRALRDQSVRVMCTQITPQCHTSLEPLRPGVIRPLAKYSTSTADPSFTSSKKLSRHVGCAGTVYAEVTDDRIIVQRVTEHRDAVDNRVKHPLCRP